jgi:hydroxypyruvate reductase
MTTLDPTALLRRIFEVAIAAAQPASCVPPHLAPAPRGRTIVIGAGKASAAMARESIRNRGAWGSLGGQRQVG